MRKQSQRHGFSLVELLVVLTILLLFCGYVLPAVYQARQAAESRQTINNLKQIVIGVHRCNDVFKKMPPAYAPFHNLKVAAPVHVYLLPFIEELRLYNAYLAQEGKNETAEAKVPTYLASEDPSAKADVKGVQNFAANLRVFSDKARRAQYNAKFDDLEGEHICSIGVRNGFPDGTSNTIVFATKFRKCGEGGSRYAADPANKFAALFGQHPAQKPADPSDGTATYQLQPGAKECRTAPLMAQSFTKKGLLIGLADATVRVIDPKMSAETWNRALHPSDGLPIRLE